MNGRGWRPSMEGEGKGSHNAHVREGVVPIILFFSFKNNTSRLRSPRQEVFHNITLFSSSNINEKEKNDGLVK